MRLELPRVLKRAGVTVLYVTQDYKEAMGLGDRIAVLQDGGFAQIGPPTEIYNNPADRQVARLFGDPTINIFDAEAEGGRVSLLDGLLKLPCRHQGRLQVGIRPEHITVGMNVDPGSVPLELDAVTPLNVRAVLLLKTKGGQEILASCGEEEGFQFGRGHSQVWASMRAADCLFFDPASGRRLRSEA